MKISIIESGIGNIQSVLNSCKRLSLEVYIAKSGEDLKNQSPDRIILPGVGTISKAITNLKSNNLWNELNNKVIKEKIPFLGICLGMQLLASDCYEFGYNKGLGWIPGKVDKIFLQNNKFILPHVGWNSLKIANSDNQIFREFDKKDFYFIHSQSFKCEKSYIIAYTKYFVDFVSIVGKDNILGVQFHPEKSSLLGEKLISNFVNYQYA